MNYLPHFVFNHRARGLPVEPYFVLGAVLPDLWLRFSRQCRVRWRAVRAAKPIDPVDAQLRDGLLNHVDADQRFHALPAFFLWQRELKARVNADGVHPAIVHFLAHLSIELALDHRLLRAEPGLADRFYDVVAESDLTRAAQRMAELGAVDTTGLDEVVRQFVARRFLRQYRTHSGLVDVVRIILALAEIPPAPDRMVSKLLSAAIDHADPALVWAQLAPGRLPAAHLPGHNPSRMSSAPRGTATTWPPGAVAGIVLVSGRRKPLSF